MGFQESTSTLFSVALAAVVFGGVFLPALHPVFDSLGGRASEDGGTLSGRFVGETLVDATLRNCEVRDGTLIRVKTHNCVIVNTEIEDSEISGGTTTGSRGTLTEFRGGTVEGGSFDTVTLTNTRVRDVTLTNVVAVGGTLDGGEVANGNLVDVAVTGASLRGVTLRSTLAEAPVVAKDATITQSQVENYTLEGGRVTLSTLLNVRIQGADVEDCNVKQADLVPRRVAREGGSLVATVSNTGSAGAYYYEVVFQVDGREAGRVVVRGTDPGMSTTVAVTAPAWASSGRLAVEVDAGERIPETNESNNRLTA